MQSDEKKIDPINPEKKRRGINIRKGEFHKVTKKAHALISFQHTCAHTHEGENNLAFTPPTGP